MLNPPLLIPLDNLNVKRNDLIRLNLKELEMNLNVMMVLVHLLLKN